MADSKSGLGDHSELISMLKNNPDLFRQFMLKFGNNEGYLVEMNRLFIDLKSSNCENIDVKIKESNDLTKLHSIIAEFKIGRELCKRGVHVKFLSDGHFRGKSPDIFCEGNGLMCYIEVFNKMEGPILTLLLDRLRGYLKDRMYRVDVEFRGISALPAIGFNDFDNQRKYIERAMAKLIAELGNEKINRQILFEQDNWVVEFDATPIDILPGFVGIISTDAFEIPEDEISKHLKYKLLEKADKRIDFPKDQRDIPYLLAVISDEAWIDEDALGSVLYGKTTFFHLHGQNKDYVERDYKAAIKRLMESESGELIRTAEQKGHGELLSERYLIPHDFYCVSEKGIYLVESKMRNVTGVLFFDTSGKMTIFTNPFSDSEINRPDLMASLRIRL